MAAREASYNVKNNTGDWEAFHDTFSTARGSLNNMQEITEAWAESEHKALVLEIRIKIIVISLIFAPDVIKSQTDFSDLYNMGLCDLSGL